MKSICLSMVLLFMTNSLFALKEEGFYRFDKPSPPNFKVTKAPISEKFKMQPKIRTHADKVWLN
jgi:hypothetical protein